MPSSQEIFMANFLSGLMNGVQQARELRLQHQRFDLQKEESDLRRRAMEQEMEIRGAQEERAARAEARGAAGTEKPFTRGEAKLISPGTLSQAIAMRRDRELGMDPISMAQLRRPGEEETMLVTEEMSQLNRVFAPFVGQRLPVSEITSLQQATFGRGGGRFGGGGGELDFASTNKLFKDFFLDQWEDFPSEERNTMINIFRNGLVPTPQAALEELRRLQYLQAVSAMPEFSKAAQIVGEKGNLPMMRPEPGNVESLPGKWATSEVVEKYFPGVFPAGENRDWEDLAEQFFDSKTDPQVAADRILDMVNEVYSVAPIKPEMGPIETAGRGLARKTVDVSKRWPSFREMDLSLKRAFQRENFMPTGEDVAEAGRRLTNFPGGRGRIGEAMTEALPQATTAGRYMVSPVGIVGALSRAAREADTGRLREGLERGTGAIAQRMFRGPEGAVAESPMTGTGIRAGEVGETPVGPTDPLDTRLPSGITVRQAYTAVNEPVQVDPLNIVPVLLERGIITREDVEILKRAHHEWLRAQFAPSGR